MKRLERFILVSRIEESCDEYVLGVKLSKEAVEKMKKLLKMDCIADVLDNGQILVCDNNPKIAVANDSTLTQNRFDACDILDEQDELLTYQNTKFDIEEYEYAIELQMSKNFFVLVGRYYGVEMFSSQEISYEEFFIKG